MGFGRINFQPRNGTRYIRLVLGGINYRPGHTERFPKEWSVLNLNLLPSGKRLTPGIASVLDSLLLHGGDDIEGALRLEYRLSCNNVPRPVEKERGYADRSFGDR
ncbi:MAG: hypothetical protein R3C11_19030 [Planctomycetaceae bacterium]